MNLTNVSFYTLRSLNLNKLFSPFLFFIFHFSFVSQEIGNSDGKRNRKKKMYKL